MSMSTCDGKPGCQGRGRRARLLEPGLLRYVVLDAIAQQPRHGYELIKLLQEQSGGWYTPSAGMIYPMLTLLEDLGYVEVQLQGPKKLYAITAAGREFLQHNQALVAAVRERLASGGGAGVEPVRERLHALREAVRSRVRQRPATPQELDRITAVLDRAIAEIQAI
ncbi:PadR family transcriptional regulator [Thiomonas sp.]|jgi:DNA-binding PadR family transcriptional regulator|uniref:PadR family transcriptional regulator n=1 Tax=Thiomonas sp. TaxID=2047785 RepID=UPI002627B7D9|nr:PadR family transcriptional regulator [Thiomonas sp.]